MRGEWIINLQQGFLNTFQVFGEGKSISDLSEFYSKNFDHRFYNGLL